MNTACDVGEKRRQSTFLRQKEYSGEDNTVNQQKDWRDIQERITTSYFMDGGHAVDVTLKDQD
eukprot:9565102-Heterocapsa_arctica.AAC.1